MPHDDLQRLTLRLGVVNAMAAKAKDTAGHDWRRARTNTSGRC
jgi:hypothetical protein